VSERLLTFKVDDESLRWLGWHIIHEINIIAWFYFGVDIDLAEDEWHVLHQVQSPQDILPKIRVCEADTLDSVLFFLRHKLK